MPLSIFVLFWLTCFLCARKSSAQFFFGKLSGIIKGRPTNTDTVNRGAERLPLYLCCRYSLSLQETSVHKLHLIIENTAVSLR